MSNEFDAKRFLVRTITIAYLALVALLFFVPVPAGNREVVIAQVAVISAGFGAIIGYFFGSSSGSAKKTDSLIENAKGGSNTQAG